MGFQEFLNAVAQMRRAQKAYFREGRKHSDLMESKRLEALVDRALAEGISVPVDQPAPQPASVSQTSLFTEEHGDETSTH